MYGTVEEATGDSHLDADSLRGGPNSSSSSSGGKYRGLLALTCLLLATVGALFLVVSGVGGGSDVSAYIRNMGMIAKNVATKATIGSSKHPGAVVGTGGMAGMDPPDPVTIVSGDGAFPDFKLLSPNFVTNGTLPRNFSCDGADGGHNPPFYWEGVPEGTVSFAFVFHSKNHWDWGLFNIPVNQTSVEEGCSYPDQRNFYSCGGSAVGSYPDKSKYYYSPPCSEGPGSKTYYWVLMALSDYLHPVDVSDSGDDAGHFDYKYAGFNIHDMMLMLENMTLATSTIVTPFTLFTD
jgi:phosphatidylethanolamine-binding protein (PEBP) family uncharacterized protein